jgi:uncharacterized protein YjiS (DUF1127 family)
MTDLIERTLRGLRNQLGNRVSRPGDDGYVVAIEIRTKPIGRMADTRRLPLASSTERRLQVTTPKTAEVRLTPDQHRGEWLQVTPGERFKNRNTREKSAMETHSQRLLYEIHGISSPLWRQSRRGRIARRAITRLLAALKKIKAAIESELAARRAIPELVSMNDRMLRDLGITRSEIESAVRRPRVNVGTDDGPVLSNDRPELGGCADHQLSRPNIRRSA